MELLKTYGIPVERRKRCVVIGRSNIVGKPMAMLLLHPKRDGHRLPQPDPGTCGDHPPGGHPGLSAVGKANFVTADMVKPGAVVVDVGMNRDEKGKLCGDVDFAGVEPVASFHHPGGRVAWAP